VPDEAKDNECCLRERLTALNTKAYYLLVALSFLYTKNSASAAPRSLKWAITLTALVAVLPLQDYVPLSALKCIRFLKVITLAAALVFTLFYIWTAR
jgi:hypothetical protein